MEVFDLTSDPTEDRPLRVPDHELSRVKRKMLEWKAASALSMFARRAGASPSPKDAWVSR